MRRMRNEREGAEELNVMAVKNIAIYETFLTCNTLRIGFMLTAGIPKRDAICSHSIGVILPQYPYDCVLGFLSHVFAVYSSLLELLAPLQGLHLCPSL